MAAARNPEHPRHPSGLLTRASIPSEEGRRIHDRTLSALRLGELIRIELESRGKDVAWLAEQVEVSPRTLNRFIEGDGNIRLWTLSDIFTALGLELKVGAAPWAELPVARPSRRQRTTAAASVGSTAPAKRGATRRPAAVAVAGKPSRHGSMR